MFSFPASDGKHSWTILNLAKGGFCWGLSPPLSLLFSFCWLVLLFFSMRTSCLVHFPGVAKIAPIFRSSDQFLLGYPFPLGTVTWFHKPVLPTLKKGPLRYLRSVLDRLLISNINNPFDASFLSFPQKHKNTIPCMCFSRSSMLQVILSSYERRLRRFFFTMDLLFAC